MNEEEAVRLLSLVGMDEGASIPKVAKRLGLGQSQLLRTLAVLGHSDGLPGLGLIEVRGDEPARLYLTAQGRAWLEQRREA